MSEDPVAVGLVEDLVVGAVVQRCRHVPQPGVPVALAEDLHELSATGQRVVGAGEDQQRQVGPRCGQRVRSHATCPGCPASVTAPLEASPRSLAGPPACSHGTKNSSAFATGYVHAGAEREHRVSKAPALRRSATSGCPATAAGTSCSTPCRAGSRDRRPHRAAVPSADRRLGRLGDPRGAAHGARRGRRDGHDGRQGEPRHRRHAAGSPLAAAARRRRPGRGPVPPRCARPPRAPGLPGGARDSDRGVPGSRLAVGAAHHRLPAGHSAGVRGPSGRRDADRRRGTGLLGHHRSGPGRCARRRRRDPARR